MNRFDFFTGATQQQSPPAITTTNMSTQYYGGSQVGSTINPGSYGYNQPNYIPQPNLQTPNFQGYVGNPNGYGGYNQPYIPQPNLQTPNFQGYVGNPAMQMVQQNPALMGGGGLGMGFGWNPYYQQPQYQDKVVHVPGVQIGPELMFQEGFQEKVEKLQLEMMVEQEKAEADRQKRFQGYFNNNYGAYNYYGMPYYTNSMDQSVYNKYSGIINDMRQQAIERKINFNKHLSRLAHSFLNDGVTDEQIDQNYAGYEYTVPAAHIEADAVQARLQRFKPVSNQAMYVEHFNMVHNAMNKLVGNAKDMNDFLEKQGLVAIATMMDDDLDKRRDTTRLYQPDAYRRYLRKSILNKMGVEEIERELTPVPGENIPFGRYFPALNESSKILEDGTLSISIPEGFGMGHGTRQIVMDNEMEQHFEENRRRFLESIYNQPRVNNGA